MHRTPIVRAQAILLLLVLMGGGFGLPMMDAVLFHQHGLTAPEDTRSIVSRPLALGTAHALGCALWTTAASGRGLPSFPTPHAIVMHWVREARILDSISPVSRDDSTLCQSRAPPLA
jgi:hypothetical protein